MRLLTAQLGQVGGNERVGEVEPKRGRLRERHVDARVDDMPTAHKSTASLGGEVSSYVRKHVCVSMCVRIYVCVSVNVCMREIMCKRNNVYQCLMQ